MLPIFVNVRSRALPSLMSDRLPELPGISQMRAVALDVRQGLKRTSLNAEVESSDSHRLLTDSPPNWIDRPLGTMPPAVMMPAAKLPLPSRSTSVDGAFAVAIGTRP